MIGTQNEGELNCMQQGSRLFTPRSTRAMEFFKMFEQRHVGIDSMFQYNVNKGRIAVGMMYPWENANSERSLIYR
jgi:hypothetical protein